MTEGLGERIKRRRTELGLTQEQLAARIPCRFQVIYRYEKGIQIPGGPRVDALARALEVDPNWILGWNG